MTTTLATAARRALRGLLAGVLLAGQPFAQAADAAAPLPIAALGKAVELAALPGGAWLALDTNAACACSTPMSVAPAAGLPQRPPLQKVVGVGGLVKDDIEGPGLYQTAQGSYLAVSSQGNSSYVVLDATPPYRLRGAFRIGIDAARGIDGVSETDGLDLTSRALGPAFPQSMLWSCRTASSACPTGRRTSSTWPGRTSPRP